jgi:hypothetical protein
LDAVKHSAASFQDSICRLEVWNLRFRFCDFLSKGLTQTKKVAKNTYRSRYKKRPKILTK